MRATSRRVVVLATTVNLFPMAAGPHPGPHARQPRVGARPRRELTLMPRFGFPCPQLGMAAGVLVTSSVLPGHDPVSDCTEVPLGETCILEHFMRPCRAVCGQLPRTGDAV